MSVKSAITDHLIKVAGGPVSVRGETLALGGAALGAAIIASEVIDDVGDIFKQKVIEESTPVWESRGKHRLMSDYGNLYRGTRVRESLYDSLFGAPVSASEEMAKGLGRQAGVSMGRPSGNPSLVVNTLASSPEVKALGRANARKLISQVSSVAPNILTQAPAAALPVLQTAIDSGSMAIRPEMLKTLADAERAYSS